VWSQTKRDAVASYPSPHAKGARTTFDDPLVLFLADWEHGEPRIVVIGATTGGRVLFVVSVEVEEDVVRIVSAPDEAIRRVFSRT
jgi:uncharacterized DUF497 family protein